MSSNVIFNPTSFEFGTGVKISLDSDKVVGNWNGGGAKIDSINLDNFSYNEFWDSKLSPGGLWFRFVGISALIVIISEFAFGGWSLESWGIFGILFVINILVFMLFMFDALFELNIFRSIIKNFFSTHCYYVTIGNKSSNNIEFYALLSERNKLLNLDKEIKELKKSISNSNTLSEALKLNHSHNNLTQNNIPKSDLDNLQQLGELYKNGILTEEEFKLKKNQILGN